MSTMAIGGVIAMQIGRPIPTLTELIPLAPAVKMQWCGLSKRAQTLGL